LHRLRFVAAVGGGNGGAQRRLLLLDFCLEGIERDEGGGRSGDLHDGVFKGQGKESAQQNAPSWGTGGARFCTCFNRLIVEGILLD